MTSFPVCVVCDTPFKYRGIKPHLLPCLHAVCSHCLDSGYNTITCSICQRSHDKQNQIFPVDHVVQTEVLHLTSEHKSSEITCTNKEDGNQAVCWCEECSDFLCEHCQISHAEVKISRDHKVLGISELSKTFKYAKSRCSKHNLIMDIYDKDCCNFICSQCFYKDHTKHITMTSDQFITLEEKNLQEQKKVVNEKNDTVILSKEKVNEHATLLEEISTRLHETVDHTFSELRSLVDQREKMVLMELEHMIDCMMTSNNNRSALLKSIDTSCRTTVDYINKCLMYSTSEHLHQLMSSIGVATEFCDNADVPQVHKDEASVSFSKQGLQDIRSAISSFGSFFTPVGQTGQPDEFSPLHSAKLNEMEAAIETLKAQIIRADTEVTTARRDLSLVEEKKKTLAETKQWLQLVVNRFEPNGLTTGSFLHIIKSGNNQVTIVKCPKMVYDSARLNRDRVQVIRGVLVNNYQESTEGNSSNKLKKYSGTSASLSLPSSGLVYWEADADVHIDQELKERILVLEIGVCGEDVMDVSHYAAPHTNSCCLVLVQSDTQDNICLYINANGQHLKTHTNFLPNKAGTVRKLQFGILYDGESMRVTFIDVTDMKILGSGVLTPTSPSKLWPVFAVFSAIKGMRLISGLEIDISTEKEQILKKALVPFY